MARLSTLAAGRERLIAAGATADVVSRFLPGGLGANFEPYWETIGVMMVWWVWESWRIFHEGYFMIFHSIPFPSYWLPKQQGPQSERVRNISPGWDEASAASIWVPATDLTGKSPFRDDVNCRWCSVTEFLVTSEVSNILRSCNWDLVGFGCKPLAMILRWSHMLLYPFINCRHHVKPLSLV